MCAIITVKDVEFKPNRQGVLRGTAENGGGNLAKKTAH